MATLPGSIWASDGAPAPARRDGAELLQTSRQGSGASDVEALELKRSTSSASLLVTRAEAHSQAALAACARTEANLGALLRTIQQLAAGVSAAQTAKDDVAQEIEHLRALLGYAHEQQLSLREQNASLEQGLQQAVHEAESHAARERSFLIEQQDAFIVSLIDDHEQAITALRSRLRAAEIDLQRYSEDRRAQANTVRAATATSFELTQKLGAAEAALSKAEGERTRLKAEAADMARENQELRAENERLRGELCASAPRADQLGASPQEDLSAETAQDTRFTRPTWNGVNLSGGSSALTGSSSPSAPLALGSSSGVPLAAVKLESRRAVLRPEDLGIRTEFSPTLPPNSSQPTVKPKPDASMRPLIGYSLVGEELREEVVESSPGRPSR